MALQPVDSGVPSTTMKASQKAYPNVLKCNAGWCIEASVCRERCAALPISSKADKDSDRVPHSTRAELLFAGCCQRVCMVCLRVKATAPPFTHAVLQSESRDATFFTREVSRRSEPSPVFNPRPHSNADLLRRSDDRCTPDASNLCAEALQALLVVQIFVIS